MKWIRYVGLATCLLFGLSFGVGRAVARDAIQAAPEAGGNLVAYDMFGTSSLNLTSYTNSAPPFSSGGDGFAKFQRNVSPSIPFAVLDDSLSIFPGDTLGVIKEGNVDEFFGIVDTENADNSGPVTAEWVFDISGTSPASDLSLSLDIGAMGDFEASDFFTVQYQIDASDVLTAFAGITDEDGSQQYVLEGGFTTLLDDPMTLDGANLTNDMTTYSADLGGGGAVLTVTLTAQFDGGSETVTLQNLVVRDNPAVAYDMVATSSLNLNSYTNSAPPFASGGDGFAKYQRFVSPSIPFAVLDDSLSIFPGDTLGIIKEGNVEEFFGIVDTENADNSGPVTAEWVFDISGADPASELSLEVDFGAMGDFEASDFFTLQYQIDAGDVMTAFAGIADEAGSQQYVLEGGFTTTLDDPMTLDGANLTNDMATYSADLMGSGAVMTVTLTAQFDGGSEAVTLQNLIVRETPAVAYDMVGTSSLNLNSYTNFAPPFASGGDGFAKYQRFVSPSIPFAVLDDSLSIFPGDTLGIIKEGNVDEFFGIVDTENADNSGPVTAEWVFDISSAGSEPLALTADFGAMGDFEASDLFTVQYQIDAGDVMTAFVGVANEDGAQEYVLEGGFTTVLDDPMTIQNTNLTDDLAPFSANLVGSGSVMTVTVTAQFDGGSEALTFQNLVVRYADPSADVPPTVVSTSPSDGASAVNPDTTITVTFSEDVTVGTGWYALTCDAVAQTATDGGGPLTYTITPTAPLPGGTTCTLDIDNTLVTDQDGDPDTMEAPFSASFGVVGTSTIMEVQGNGFTSPLEGTSVSVEGVVTGFFEGNFPGFSFFDGFFIQDPTGDGDPATSDGIFVNIGSLPLTVAVGDLVSVSGVVQEFNEFDDAGCVEDCVTQILVNDPSGIVVTGSGTFTSTTLAPPTDTDDMYEYWEALEGMHVTQPLTATVVGPTSFGTIQVLDGAEGVDRAFRDSPQHGKVFGVRHYELFGDIGGGDPPNLITGSIVENVAGPLHPTYGPYVVITQEGTPWTTVTSVPAPVDEPTWPMPAANQLTVASFNVLNFDDGNPPDQVELDKIVQTISNMGCPTFVGLQEVDTTSTLSGGGDNVLPELVAALTTAGCANYDYAFSHPDVGDHGVAALWDTTRITSVMTSTHIQGCHPDGSSSSTYDPLYATCQASGEFPTFSRRPLVVTATVDLDGMAEQVVFVANHFKSQLGGTPSDNRRLAQATLVREFVDATIAAGTTNVVVLGDLNDFYTSATLAELQSSGNLTSLWDGVPANERYSYVFRGLSQALDHILVSPGLVADTVDFAAQHTNSDFPFLPYANDGTVVWRASDHDPLVATLQPEAADVVYTSFDGSGTVGAVSYDPVDILQQADGVWSMYFDGSDVGLAAANVDAFLFYQGGILMSFTGSTSVPGVGTVAAADLVLFNPTALGDDTAGTFVWAFDGSDVGLTTAEENVDGIAIGSNALILSTNGSFSVPGVVGEDEDVLRFFNATFGPNTSGDWELYFDGSDIGLGAGPERDIDGLWVDGAGNVHASTVGAFTLGPVTVDGNDIVVCALGTLGANTSCNLAQSGIYWDGATNGVSSGVNGFTVVEPAAVAPIVPALDALMAR